MLHLPSWALRVGAGLAVTGVAVWIGRRHIARVVSDLWYGDVEITHAREVLNTVDFNLKQLRADLQAASADRPASQAGNETGLTGRGASGYYHFSSDGVRLPSKWDSFDADAEVAKIDNDSDVARKPASSGSNTTSGPTSAKAGESVSKRVMRVQQLALDAERLLRDLDTILLMGPGVDEATQSAAWQSTRRSKRRLIDSVHALLRDADAVEAKLRAAL